MERGGRVLSVFREMHFPYCARDCSPPSRPLPFFPLSSSTFSDVSARWCTVERAFRSAPHILPLSFCRIRPSTSPFRRAIEFSYVHAIYNVVRAKPPRDSSSHAGARTLKLLKRAERALCAGLQLRMTFLFFFLVRVAARMWRIHASLCCASISIAVRNAFRCYFFSFFLAVVRGHLSIDNPYCESPLHGFALTRIVLAIAWRFAKKTLVFRFSIIAGTNLVR